MSEMEKEVLDVMDQMPHRRGKAGLRSWNVMSQIFLPAISSKK